jgi:hypothetical protein
MRARGLDHVPHDAGERPPSEQPRSRPDGHDEIPRARVSWSGRCFEDDRAIVMGADDRRVAH